MRLSGDNPGWFDMVLVMCDDKARLLSDMGSVHVFFYQCTVPGNISAPLWGCAMCIADQKICETI
jgi:hypothetical protein